MTTDDAPTLDNPGTKVLKPSKLAHVVLRTNNLKGMSAFYKTFLQATATLENDFLTFVTYDDEHHRIGIVGMPEIADKNVQTCGLEHIAFTYDNLHDLALAYLQRKANKIDPFWCINHGPTTSVYYHDPDGNIIETQVENFSSPQEAIDFMQSDAYRINPIGVDFDMKNLIGRIQAGEDDKSLKARPASGPRGIDSVPA